MKLNPTPFAMVKSRQKWVEMRLYDEKRRKIQVGDKIEFIQTETSEQLMCEVKGMCVCVNFDELYSRYDKLALGYRHEEPAEPKDMLSYYSLEDITAFGVVGIELELTV